MEIRWKRSAPVSQLRSIEVNEARKMDGADGAFVVGGVEKVWSICGKSKSTKPEKWEVLMVHLWWTCGGGVEQSVVNKTSEARKMGGADNGESVDKSVEKCGGVTCSDELGWS